MKIHYFQNWCNQSGEEDKWYISVNGDSDTTIYNLDEVKAILDDFKTENVHIVHVTQKPINGISGWIKLEPNNPASSINSRKPKPKEDSKHTPPIQLTQQRASSVSFDDNQTASSPSRNNDDPTVFSPRDWLIHLGGGGFFTYIVYVALSNREIAGFAWFWVLLWAYLAGFESSVRWLNKLFFGHKTHPNTVNIFLAFWFIIWTLLFFQGCESDRAKARSDVYRLQEYRQNYR